MLSETQRIKNMTTPQGKTDIVIDSDTYNEIDDQFAISYAMHAPEKLTVKALYAAPFLNERSTGPADGMEKSFQEIHKLLKLATGKGNILYSEGQTDICRMRKHLFPLTRPRISYSGQNSIPRIIRCMWWRSAPSPTSHQRY